MGIDIYARWTGQTLAEEEAQYESGFSSIRGHVGTLREAYHGEPYATGYLVREAFADPHGQAEIPAVVLRERLPRMLELVRERERVVYGEIDEKEIQDVLQSFSDFVELCEAKERSTGEPVTIIASF